jgi:4-hydroxy-3-polyprenylbenzoate decarboxylase
LVIAAVGAPVRELATVVPASLRLPAAFTAPALCVPGVLAVRGPRFAAGADGADAAIQRFCRELAADAALAALPLIVVCDDSEFCARSLANFLWVTFTRSDPARDVHGVGEFVRHKHWGCAGPLVIDAREKPHHAPPLEPDPEITARVNRLAQKGGPLHGII